MTPRIQRGLCAGCLLVAVLSAPLGLRIFAQDLVGPWPSLRAGEDARVSAAASLTADVSEHERAARVETPMSAAGM